MHILEALQSSPYELIKEVFRGKVLTYQLWTHSMQCQWKSLGASAKRKQWANYTERNLYIQHTLASSVQKIDIAQYLNHSKYWAWLLITN